MHALIPSMKLLHWVSDVPPTSVVPRLPRQVRVTRLAHRSSICNPHSVRHTISESSRTWIGLRLASGERWLELIYFNPSCISGTFKWRSVSMISREIEQVQVREISHLASLSHWSEELEFGWAACTNPDSLVSLAYIMDGQVKSELFPIVQHP